MSDLSTFAEHLWSDVVAVFHGQPPSVPLKADAQKFVDDVEAFVSGLAAAGPYAPSLIGDTARLVAEGAAIVASKGLSLPLFLAAGSTLQSLSSDLSKFETAFLSGVKGYYKDPNVTGSMLSSLASDFSKAETAFLQAVGAYKSSAAVVAVAP